MKFPWPGSVFLSGRAVLASVGAMSLRGWFVVLALAVVAAPPSFLTAEAVENFPLRLDRGEGQGEVSMLHRFRPPRNSNPPRPRLRTTT